MKIGIITFYYKNYNYGGLLQAYALSKVLENLTSGECSVEQICFDQHKDKIQPLDKITRVLCRTNIKKKLGKKTDVKYKAEIPQYVKNSMSQFAEDYIPHTETVYSESSFASSQQFYDVYICGSDQIWNPVAVRNAYLLADIQKRKVAYAPSIAAGKLKLPERIKYKKYLCKFDSISVREKSAADQISKLLKKPVPVVLDPVLLLDSNEWDRLTQKCISSNGRYMFVYTLGKLDDVVLKVIEEYKRSGNTVRGIEGFSPKGSTNYCHECSPCDFINLIKGAEVIVTDSFHAMVFSVIYKKDFYIFGRKGSAVDMSERISDFLQMTHLEGRYKTELIKEFEPIKNYAEVEKIIIEARKASMCYLEEALQ